MSERRLRWHALLVAALLVAIGINIALSRVSVLQLALVALAIGGLLLVRIGERRRRRESRDPETTRGGAE